jgi:hypothetical protein
MSFAIKNARSETACPKEFWKRLFRYKSCTFDTQTCTFDTQMFVNPDTSGLPSSNNNSKKPRLHVLVTGRTRFLMTSSHYCFIIILQNRGFLKYYINNKYKQLNIRTMAESFEGKKIISNPLANLRPQKSTVQR